MQILASILLYQERLQKNEVDELLALHPRALATASYFQCELPHEDERIQQLRSLLDSWGFAPCRHANFAKTYRFALLRKYEAADFAQAEWLVPMGPWDSDFAAEDPERENDGQLLIPRAYFKRKRFVDRLDHDHLIISTDMRQALDEAGLSGMLYREAKPAKGRSLVKQGSLWEVTSAVLLPPLSPCCELYDAAGARVHGQQGSPAAGLRFEEGFYHPEEFHYRRSDFAGFPPVDFALTCEWLGEGRPSRHLLVSNRFYHFCKAQGLDLYWIPVRIDPE
jgi:hypothetical protein